MTKLTITSLEPGELSGLAWFLDAANLPSADLRGPARTFFCFDGDSLVDHGGLEGEGADRLLRSIVILNDRLGHGLGRKLIATLEQKARNLGVRRLHLRTMTAASLFRALSYVDTDRVAAPPAAGSSHAFTALCPASAFYREKVL